MFEGFSPKMLTLPLCKVNVLQRGSIETRFITSLMTFIKLTEVFQKYVERPSIENDVVDG